MTELLYQTDSYMQTFEAVITGLDEASHAIILDRTAFYPGGGGQPFDTGTLTVSGSNQGNSPMSGESTIFHVKRAKKDGDRVLHLIEEPGPLPVAGTPVHGQLDWERRYALMRTHTALHVLCGVVFRDYGALVTGGDMDPLQGRMDFEFETMQKELVSQIESAVNTELVQARPVKVAILPREQAFQIPDLIRTKINLLPEGIQSVRTVEIVGLDLQADGGTHVANTQEVGRVRVTDYKSKGKINKRIYIEVKD